MFRSRWALAFLLLSFITGQARADGLFYQLPKDGAWALYEFDAAFKSKSKVVLTSKGTLRIASVGKATEDDQSCRWLEVQLDTTLSIGKVKEVKAETFKILVPEIFLAKGETPLVHVLRAWYKRGDGEPTTFKRPGDLDHGPLPLALSGPWKEVKQLGKVETESKLGKLECEGVKGMLDLPRKQTGLARCLLESRLHPDSPFGTVSARWEVDQPKSAPMQGTMEWNLKLIDFGDKAASKMPNAK